MLVPRRLSGVTGGSESVRQMARALKNRNEEYTGLHLSSRHEKRADREADPL